uniref:Uncharacterized protein n=1 Tax=Rhizophora mucronata TaxID=61149 RepID=A0A2P2KTK6_RHIMU
MKEENAKDFSRICKIQSLITDNLELHWFVIEAVMT